MCAASPPSSSLQPGCDSSEQSSIVWHGTVCVWTSVGKIFPKSGHGLIYSFLPCPCFFCCLYWKLCKCQTLSFNVFSRDVSWQNILPLICKVMQPGAPTFFMPVYSVGGLCCFCFIMFTRISTYTDTCGHGNMISYYLQWGYTGEGMPFKKYD